MLVGIVTKHLKSTEKSHLDAADWEGIARELNGSFSGWNFTGKQCANHWHRKGLNPNEKVIGKKRLVSGSGDITYKTSWKIW
jgi:hypothetical protein